jgi:hypothetical protein
MSNGNTPAIDIIDGIHRIEFEKEKICTSK